MSERTIKNALVLLEEIGMQLVKLESGKTDYKLGSLAVCFYHNKTLRCETSLGMAIHYLAGDIYWNENANWADANKVEVIVL